MHTTCVQIWSQTTITMQRYHTQVHTHAHTHAHTHTHTPAGCVKEGSLKADSAHILEVLVNGDVDSVAVVGIDVG